VADEQAALMWNEGQMRFNRMPSVFPGQALYGASGGGFTFIISDDRPDGFTASAKIAGATPFDGKRNDLGGFAAHRSLAAAEEACEQFLRKRQAR